MTECPEIEALTGAESPRGALADHVGQCEACSAVIALANVRQERQSGRDDECVRAEVEIALWHLGELDPAARSALIAHLESCTRCNEAAVRLRSLPSFQDESTDVRPLARAVPVDSPPSREKPAARRLMPFVIAPAAAAALLLISLLGLGVSRVTVGSERVETLSSGAGSAIRARARTGSFSPVEVTPSLPAPDAASASAISAPPAPAPLSSAPVREPRESDGFFTAICDPLCTDVRVDGRSVGPSPIVRLALAPGGHDVTLIDGDLQKRLQIQIVSGGTTARRVKMSEASEGQGVVDPWTASPKPNPYSAEAQDPFAKKAGFLTLICSPACTSVVADGKNLGPSPIVRTPLSPGVHKLSLTSLNANKHLSITIQPGQLSSFRVEMERQNYGF